MKNNTLRNLKNFNRFVSIAVIASFLSLTGPMDFVFAQVGETPLAMNLSLPYTPTMLRGLELNREDPLSFSFIVDAGDDDFHGEQLKAEGEKLIKYFLTSLTVPEEDIWVNLSPYEEDRIIPDAFGATDMGRDLLDQDSVLKKVTASLLHPQTDIGRQFWKKIREQIKDQYGDSDIPVDALNKVWIVPEKAIIYEAENAAYVVDTKLKVLMEEDYIALANNDTGHRTHDTSQKVAADVMREIVIPAIEKEVNEGKNFAPIRQIFNAHTLAIWYKTALKETLLSSAYADRNAIEGIEIEDKEAKQKIYEKYLETFTKGVYEFIGEEYDPQSQKIVAKKYFSGGSSSLIDGASLAERLTLVKDQTRAAIASQDEYVRSKLAGFFGSLELSQRLRKLYQFLGLYRESSEPNSVLFSRILNRQELLRLAALAIAGSFATSVRAEEVGNVGKVSSRGFSNSDYVAPDGWGFDVSRGGVLKTPPVVLLGETSAEKIQYSLTIEPGTQAANYPLGLIENEGVWYALVNPMVVSSGSDSLEFQLSQTGVVTGYSIPKQTTSRLEVSADLVPVTSVQTQPSLASRVRRDINQYQREFPNFIEALKMMNEKISLDFENWRSGNYSSEQADDLLQRMVANVAEIAQQFDSDENHAAWLTLLLLSQKFGESVHFYVTHNHVGELSGASETLYPEESEIYMLVISTGVDGQAFGRLMVVPIMDPGSNLTEKKAIDGTGAEGAVSPSVSPNGGVLTQEPVSDENGGNSDPAVSAERRVGGVDLSQSSRYLQIKRNSKGIPLPMEMQDLQNISLKGISPYITNVLPLNQLPGRIK